VLFKKSTPEAFKSEGALPIVIVAPMSILNNADIDVAICSRLLVELNASEKNVLCGYSP
jgi:hypothetical protein